MALHEITVVKNDSLKNRLVIPAHEPESTKNGANISNQASIYRRFRLKSCRNDGGVISIQKNSIFVQSQVN